MQHGVKRYSLEPADARAFTAEYDRFYTQFSKVYDRLVRLFPIWRDWLTSTLPALEGPRVLEVGFGTGYLMTHYAGSYDAYGVDLNAALIEVAAENLRTAGLSATLQRGTVEALPFSSGTFDTVLSTMAFSGFPDGQKALAEMIRVLKRGGRIVLVDVSLPEDGGWAGTLIARGFEAGGDILRDMAALLDGFDVVYEISTVGGFGSVQRIVAQKKG